MRWLTMNKCELTNSIQAFLNYRALEGYKINIYRRHMSQFEHWCSRKNIKYHNITDSILTEFCYEKNESEQTKRARMNMMIQYSLYLQKCNHSLTIPRHRSANGYPTRSEPYIYSVIELKCFFKAIDNWGQSPYSHSNRVKVDPILFRLYYGCGLRLKEALNLKRKDVDVTKGLIYIWNGKNNRSRVVPMAYSLQQRCQEYVTLYLGADYDLESYFFYTRNPKAPANDRAIYERFRQYLQKANIPHSGHGPRIHDLRHTFCVHRLKQWVLDKKDLNVLLPYLSKYMGHVDFRGTEYYLRLTADLYPEIVERMNVFEAPLLPTLTDGRISK